MKRTAILLATVLTVSVLGSCNKLSEGGPAAGGDATEVKTGNVFFTFTGTQGTRAGLVTDDNTIGSAQVAVFNGDAMIGYESKTISAISGTVEIKGLPLNVSLDCYAVVNCTESISGKSKEDIAAMTVELKDFGSSNLPMYASGSKSFTETDKSLTLSLKRASSKIEIQKVTANFTSAAIAAQTSKVTAIYVYNAPGKYCIGLTEPASQVYYHAAGYSTADASTLGAAAPLVGETGLDGDITGNKAYTTGHDFYCCPNSGDGTWLTIETSIGGHTYYYGVQMAELKANTKYVVTNAVLTGVGNDNPPGIVDNGNISINLTVEDWTTGFSKEVSF